MKIIYDTRNKWLKNNRDFFGVSANGETYWECWTSDSESCRLKDIIVSKLGDKYTFTINKLQTVWQVNCCLNGIERKLLIIPQYTTEMTWLINNSYYAPRGIIKRTKSLSKIDNVVNCFESGWSFDCNTNTKREFIENSFSSSNLSERAQMMLKAFCPDFKLGENLNTFKRHLRELPNTNYTDILNYDITDYTFIFDSIYDTLDKTFTSQTRTVINCNLLISKIGRVSKDELNDFILILNNDNNVFLSCSNLRSVLYQSKKASRDFMFTNVTCFFDSFKVTTDKNAGKIRTLLDNCEIRDSIIYADGVDMFNVYKEYYINKTRKNQKSLSELSISPYCFNNDPKRIMMTAKAYCQSVPTERSGDDPLNLNKCKIIFMDYKGYNIGDGLVISESFAKSLTTTGHKTFYVKKKYLKKFAIGNKLTIRELCDSVDTFTNTMLRYKDITVEKVEGSYVTVSYKIVMSIGDKLTNRHGAKGVIIRIIPDDEMPKLVSCSDPSIELGPFDIISSAYGIKDRANIGQIYEATGKQKITGTVLVDGEEYTDKTFGVTTYLRLHHFNITHNSYSDVTNPQKQINLGDMEIINIQTQDPMLIKEMICRSDKNKDENAILGLLNNTYNYDRKGNIIEEAIKCLGYEFNISD